MISKILTPFFVAFIFAYGLQPLIQGLCFKYKLPKTPVIYSIFIIFIILISIAIAVLIPMLYEEFSLLINKIPVYRSYLQNELLPILTNKLQSIDPEIANKLNESMMTLISSTFSLITGLFNNVWGYTLSTINTVAIILVIPIILLYFLRDWSKMINNIDDLLPVKEKSKIRQILFSINELLSGYIRGQFNVCLLLSIFYGISLSLIGIDLALLIGLLSGFLIIIPFIGVFIAFLLALSVCYFSFGISVELAYISTLYVVGGLLETYILTPKIIGDRIGLHPLWIMFAVFSTGSLFGFVGVLFAIPIAGIIKVLLGYGIEFYKTTMIYK
jgi:putative permease